MSFKGFEIDEAALDEILATHPKDQPIYMLNVIKYKKEADYSWYKQQSWADSSQCTPCSGRDAYFGRYIPAFMQTAGDIKGFSAVFLGKPYIPIIAPAGEEWDTVALVQYPNLQVFVDIVRSESYKKNLLHHRLAAIENYRLIPCAQTPLN